MAGIYSHPPFSASLAAGERRDRVAPTTISSSSPFQDRRGLGNDLWSSYASATQVRVNYSLYIHNSALAVPLQIRRATSGKPQRLVDGALDVRLIHDAVPIEIALVGRSRSRATQAQ